MAQFGHLGTTMRYRFRDRSLAKRTNHQDQQVNYRPLPRHPLQEVGMFPRMEHSLPRLMLSLHYVETNGAAPRGVHPAVACSMYEAEGQDPSAHHAAHLLHAAHLTAQATAGWRPRSLMNIIVS